MQLLLTSHHPIKRRATCGAFRCEVVEKSPHAAFTLVELLVVLVIIGILLGLLMPAVQAAREAARRVECANNLKQIGIALHLHHDTQGRFPPSGWTGPGPGNSSGKYVGWRPLILPFLEKENLHRVYDFQFHWWEGTNPVAASVPISTFRCTSTPAGDDVLWAKAKSPRPEMVFETPIAATDYEAIMGVQPNSVNPHLANPRYDSMNRFSVLSRNSTTRFSDIHDGTTTTIMIVECAGRPRVYRGSIFQPDLRNDQGIGWADSEGPFSLDGASPNGNAEGCGPAGNCTMALNARNDNEPYSFHPGTSLVLYADGHVGIQAETVDLISFAALCTMNAGD